MKRSLLLGCGNSREKKIYQNGESDWVGELTRLDMDINCGADVVWDLECRPLPFDSNYFDELAAYDVLEHIGRQGDWKGWFDEMAEYHRILKPGGTFGVLVPIGQDALADPGHTRFFQKNYFGFLCDDFYTENLKKGAPVTDYRWYKKFNFELLHYEEHGGHHFSVLLRKPL